MDVYWRTYTPAPPYPGDKNTDNAFQSTYAVTSTGVDWTITPHLVNQFNFGLLNTQEEFNAGNSFNPFTAEGNVIINAPSFFNGAQVLATTIPSYMLPEPRNNPVWDWTDNMTWTRGNHNVYVRRRFPLLKLARYCDSRSSVLQPGHQHQRPCD